jgi:hypothetical protein
LPKQTNTTFPTVFVRFEEGFGLAQGDASGALQRETVRAGADGGESDGRESVLRGQGEAVAIAVGQRLAFAALATLPDGPTV